MSDEEFDSPQDRIDQLVERADRAVDRMDNRTAVQLLLEALRLAKQTENAASYMYLLFRLTNSRDMMEPVRLRDWAIELIAMLESDERVRSIQADYDEWHVDWLRSRLSSCAYDNLATHVASIQGYNSTGMHDCIAEGIQVCRRTNKLECITCFREYATDVYTASDDLEMAAHYAQLCIEQTRREDKDDRRYVGYSDLAGIQFLNGRIDAALGTLRACLEVVPHYHSPLDARIETHREYTRVLLLAGRFDDFESICGEPRLQYEGDPDSNRRHYCQQTVTDALIAACHGEYDAAINKLIPIDQLLTRNQCLHDWFNVRIQLIAAHLLNGNEPAARRLATALEAKASAAQDWLTLRRLNRLMNPDQKTDPFGLLQAPEYGPWSPREAGSAGVNVSRSSPAERVGPLAEGEENPDPEDHLTDDDRNFAAALQELRDYVQISFTQGQEVEDFWPRILSVPIPGRINRSLVAQLLHLTRFVPVDSDRVVEIWDWAQKLSRMWQDDASVTGLAAYLFDRLIPCEVLADKGLSPELVERMMTRAASLGSDKGSIQKLVGRWYQKQGLDGKAEQALARAFRIDRSDSEAAMALAMMYQQQERPRDALAALDLCLRSGGNEPDVFWEAGLTAWSIDRYESAITYFQELSGIQPERRWSQYYVALASLELGRPEPARLAITAERAVTSGQDYHLLVLDAAVAFQLQQIDSAMDRVRQILTTSVSQVDYLSPGGFECVYRLLWCAAFDRLGEGEAELLYDLAMHMTKVGFGPDPFFNQKRQAAPNSEPGDVMLFTCHVRQRLPANWKETLYCRPEESGWTAYECRWGVLAGSESDAEEFVRRIHSEIHELPVEFLSTDQSDDEYEEIPGIVWQGYRTEA